MPITTASAFQSQMRSQSSGDFIVAVYVELSLCVSIADAKPILWRPISSSRARGVTSEFQSQMRSQSSGDTISTNYGVCRVYSFQSQMRSQSSGDVAGYFSFMASATFQSQMRSQSSGDQFCRLTVRIDLVCFNRRCEANPLATCIRLDYIIAGYLSFNRRCEANPLATDTIPFCRNLLTVRFNRRCEANPLATYLAMPTSPVPASFQSQMRSQSSGDTGTSNRHTGNMTTFQSQMRSQSSGDSGNCEATR